MIGSVINHVNSNALYLFWRWLVRTPLVAIPLLMPLMQLAMLTCAANDRRRLGNVVIMKSSQFTTSAGMKGDTGRVPS
jgi:hypothetical protein